MTDAPLNENLTDRQKHLLILLVRSHIDQPEPVSSSSLAQKAAVSVSSATVRNEMAVLEEKGYIRSPHTSSGRVPTEAGYRFFAKYLLENEQAVAPRTSLIQSQLTVASLDIDTWMQTTAMMLAQETGSAALVTEPRVRAENRFKHIQLISIQGRMVLMVLVLTSGYVHQQMLLMSEPVPQPMLTAASDILNRHGYDKNANGIQELSRTLSTTLAQEIALLTADALEQMDALSGRIGYQAGLSDLLPRLEDEGAQQAIRVLEGETDLDAIVNEIVESSEQRVHVVVAGEGRWESLSNLSMVLARYGTGHLVGAIGVMGPTRMRYGRAIPAVRYVAEVVSRFLEQVHDGSTDTTDKAGQSPPDMLTPGKITGQIDDTA